MRSAGLTQAELARRSGLAESMVSRWLRGLNQPDVPNLRRVRPVLGVPMLELIVAAGYLSLEEAELQDAPQPPAPVQVGHLDRGADRRPGPAARGLRHVPARAERSPRAVEPRAGRGAGRAAALRGVRRGEADQEQQARVREQARLAREEAARSGRQVVFLDEPDEQRR